MTPIMLLLRDPGSGPVQFYASRAQLAVRHCLRQRLADPNPAGGSRSEQDERGNAGGGQPTKQCRQRPRRWNYNEQKKSPAHRASLRCPPGLGIATDRGSRHLNQTPLQASEWSIAWAMRVLA